METRETTNGDSVPDDERALVRSEPLGWLAPIAAAPPAAVFGGVLELSSMWNGLAIQVGVSTALALVGTAACWGMRERRALPLAVRTLATMMLAGALLPALWVFIDADAELRWWVWGVAGVTLFGAIMGIACGTFAAVALAAMLRLHRGPRRRSRALAIAALGWVAVGLVLGAFTDGWLPIALIGASSIPIAAAMWTWRRGAPPPAVAAPEADPKPALGPRWTRALFLFGPGLVLGLIVLERSIPPGSATGPQLLATGLAPAALAALIGGFAARAPTAPWAAGRAFAASVLAGLMCPALSWAVLRACGGDPATFDERLSFDTVALLGGWIGVPAGLALGVIFAATMALAARLSRGALARPIERAMLGASWIAAAGATMLLELVVLPRSGHLLGPIPVSDTRAWIAGVALAVLAVGALIAMEASLRLVRAARLVRLARRGLTPQYEVIPHAELADHEETIAALPAYFPFGRTDAVLVRRAWPSTAPFRDASVSEPIALVPR